MHRVPYTAKEADAYIGERATAPCLICEIVAGGARRRAHEIVYEDDRVIALSLSL